MAGMFQFAKLLAISLLALAAALLHGHLSSGATVPTVMRPVAAAALNFSGASIVTRDRSARPCALSRERDQAADCR
jgi:hypothetical protein